MNVKTEYNWKRNRADAVVYLQPDDFIFNGENHSSKYWVDLIDSLCKILKEKDSQKMDEFLEDEKNRPRRIPYLAKEEKNIHFKKYLPKSDLWLNQKIDAPRSVKLIRKLLEKYDVQPDEFQLYLRLSDYA